MCIDALQLINMAQSIVQPDWGELQIDVLDLVLTKLGAVDVIRVRAVCSSWNRAVKRCLSSKPKASWFIDNPLFGPQSSSAVCCYIWVKNRVRHYLSCNPSAVTPLHQSPWLLQTTRRLRKASPTPINFFNPAEDYKSYKLYLGEFSEGGGEVVGSSFRWLAILTPSRDSLLHLVNPFTRAILPIPFTKVTFNPGPRFVYKVVLSSDPFGSYAFSVVVAESSTSVSNHGRPQALVILRYRCDGCSKDNMCMQWLFVRLNNGIWDDMMCHDGRVYAFSNETRTLLVQDIYGGPEDRQIFDIEPFPIMYDPRWVLPPRGSRYQLCRTSILLVESLGEVLFLEPVQARFADGHECGSGLSITIGFIVSKLNFRERRRIALEALPGQAILLGSRRNAVSVSTRDFPEFEDDSIYFVDGCDHRLNVYNLKEGKTRMCRQWDRLKFDQQPGLEHSSHWIFPVFGVRS